jgi:peptidoglycan/xylan/chitin deacetylase (PgdA/CDA1 family)
MMLPRILASALSPGGRRASLSILIFHRVLAQPDALFPTEPDACRFEQQLSWLSRMFRVLPLEEAVSALHANALPPRAAAITFDDGYADNFTVALPLLRKHGMSATFFVACGFLDGGRMWNDTIIEAVRRCAHDELDLRMLGLGHFGMRSPAERRRAIDSLLSASKYLSPRARESRTADIVAHCGTSRLPDDLMMTGAQVRALRDAGMTVGGHTCTHPILSQLPDTKAFEEIADGKARLESLLGEKVTLFAYPNGKPGRDYHVRHREMVQRAGFKAAVTTSVGTARPNTDPFQLPRFTPWDRTPMRYGLRLVRNMRRSGSTA